MNFQTLNKAILTGAGFTANFGGFLASDMVSVIFNEEELHKHDELLKLFLEDDRLDYETIYSKVIYGDYVAEVQNALRNVYNGAYGQLDSRLREFTFVPGSPYPVNLYGIQRLIKCFSGEQRSRGHFFTVNHDLFMERWYSGGVKVPGMQQPMGMQGRAIEDGHIIPVPNETKMATARIEDEKKPSSSGWLQYIKLHGSMNWRTADGKNAMVIAGNKPARIRDMPLLQWYFEKFSKVLSEPKMRLLAIGYSFGDEHINEVIAQAVQRDHPLRLYVVYPRGVAAFISMLKARRYGNEISAGLQKCWPCLLQDVFPANQHDTAVATEMMRLFVN